MPISLNSPNVDNYYVGKGIVSVKFLDTPVDPGYVDIGNVSELEFTPNLDKLEHFSSREGVKEKDRSIVISKAAELRMVMDELTARNLSMLLMGTAVVAGGVATIDIFNENVRVAAVKYTGNNDIGPKWNFDFPRVEFAPGSSVNLISEEWGTLEAKGEVVRVGGSFGTASATFVESAPVNQVLPAIIHTSPPNVGEVLTAFPGQWTGNPTFAYQWQKGGVDIAGATGTTYTPVAGDVGGTLTVEVDATNSFSTVQAESAATAAVV